VTVSAIGFQDVYQGIGNGVRHEGTSASVLHRSRIRASVVNVNVNVNVRASVLHWLVGRQAGVRNAAE
jgi:hypothetical protein